MSESRGIKFALLSTWLSKLATVLSNLLIMPLLYRALDKETLGVWFTLNGSNTMLVLMSLGVAPSMMRQVAMLAGRHGPAGPTPEGASQLANVLVTGKGMLQVLSAVNFFTAFGLGYFFLGKLTLTTLSFHTVITAWALMCLGFSFYSWWSYLDAYLAGMGHVGWDVMISGGMLVLTAAGSATAVMLGGGLISLAAVPVGVALLNRVLLLRIIHWKLPDLSTHSGRFHRETAHALGRSALTVWIGSLGAFLILRTDNYFIATLRGVRDIPAYQAAYSLAFNLLQIAASRTNSSNVFVSRAWRPDAPEPVHAMTLAGARFAAILLAAGCAFLLTSGHLLTDLWLGPGNFVGLPVLTVFCVMITLEAQHTSLLSSAWAIGDTKYAKWMVLAGTLNLVLTYSLIRPLGLLGVALGTCLAQMFTNNWYIVRRSCHVLRLPFQRYAASIWPVWAAAFAGCAVLEGSAVHWLAGTRPASRALTLLLNALVSAAAVAYFLRDDLAGPARGLLRRFGWPRPVLPPAD